jgi:glycosyltransferase involved in cell wall biosynthesis
LDRLGIPSIGFRDLPEATDSDAQMWGIELAGDLPVGGAVSSKETVAYLGASFRDLVDEYGELDARRRYSETKRQAFLPVATMRRFIERISPDLVVATNSPRAERAAILAAGQLGIPSVCVVDLFAIQEVQWIGQPGYATRVCVLNDSVRGRLLAHGRDAHEIAVTGNPAFDQLSAPENIQAGAQLRRERGWDDGKKIILWASQIEPLKHPFVDLLGDPTLPCRVEEYLREIVTADENLRLVVRYHPSERNVFNRANRVDFSPLSEPIATLLHAVDVVVVTASTVGLEAALSGRPVISVDLSVFTPDTQYASMGISTGVTDLSELKMALKKSLASVAPVMIRGHSSNSSTKNVLQVINTLLIK